MEMLAWWPLWPDFGQILDSYWSKSSHLDSHWSAVVKSTKIDYDECVEDFIVRRTWIYCRAGSASLNIKENGRVHYEMGVTT